MYLRILNFRMSSLMVVQIAASAEHFMAHPAFKAFLTRVEPFMNGQRRLIRESFAAHTAFIRLLALLMEVLYMDP